MAEQLHNVINYQHHIRHILSDVNKTLNNIEFTVLLWDQRENHELQKRCMLEQ